MLLKWVKVNRLKKRKEKRRENRIDKLINDIKKRKRKIEEKEEIARYEQFLLFSQYCFFMVCSSDNSYEKN